MANDAPEKPALLPTLLMKIGSKWYYPLRFSNSNPDSPVYLAVPAEFEDSK